MIFTVNAYGKPGIRSAVAGDPAAPAIEFAAPPEFQGEAGVWSPEHFLLAAVASCFVTTFKAIARISKFEFASLVVTVDGDVEKVEGGYAFTRVLLKPELDIERESDRERGQQLLGKTERSCLIARSLKATVSMQPAVHVSPAVRAA